MPTYSYRCTACDHRFDIVQKFTDTAITECPLCGSPVKKIFHAAGVVFKGSGWYINDSRSSSSPATTTAKPSGDGADKSSDSAGKTSDSASSTKKESKNETKSPAPAKSSAAD